jgi:hypothetical protein
VHHHNQPLLSLHTSRTLTAVTWRTFAALNVNKRTTNHNFVPCMVRLWANRDKVIRVPIDSRWLTTWSHGHRVPRSKLFVLGPVTNLTSLHAASHSVERSPRKLTTATFIALASKTVNSKSKFRLGSCVNVLKWTVLVVHWLIPYYESFDSELFSLEPPLLNNICKIWTLPQPAIAV